MLALPIRMRLTLWYSLALAITMFTIGMVALWMVHGAIDDIEKHELKERVRSVRRFIESRPSSETQAQLHADISEAYDVSHGNKWLQVIDEHGNWLYRSAHVAAAFPNLDLPQDLHQEERYFTYVAESIPVRALIAPITVHGVRYTVQTGLTLSQTLAILSNIRIQLFLLIGAGLILSAAGGHFMSRKALLPVAALANEAKRINDRHLDIRLPVPAAKDEISDLSRTLNQMLERIDKSFTSVRTITGNASHELRTPISLLRTEIEVALIHPRDGAEYVQILHRLHGNTVRITNLVENLLTLARADATCADATMEPVNLVAVIEEACDMARPIAFDRSLSLEVSLDSTRSARVLGDFSSLRRLLWILLDNALKYSATPGKIEVSLNVSTDRVTVLVQDNGMGIAADDLPHVFDRFFRAAPSRSQVEGSGLGLAIAKWIADLHQAEISVSSELGKGTLVQLVFPVCTLPSSVQ